MCCVCVFLCMCVRACTRIGVCGKEKVQRGHLSGDFSFQNEKEIATVLNGIKT